MLWKGQKGVENTIGQVAPGRKSVDSVPEWGKLNPMMAASDRRSAPSSCLWIGAPTVLVLATCVSAQAATQAPHNTRATPDSAWIAAGSAPAAVGQVRESLAKRAAYVIHTADWISGAGLPACAEVAEAHETEALVPGCLAVMFDPSSSTHQSSAP